VEKEKVKEEKKKRGQRGSEVLLLLASVSLVVGSPRY
jgi:hypothetical protein